MILFDSATMARVTGGVWHGHPPECVNGIAFDTRGELQGKLFAALRGERDGHDFLSEALGACGAIVEQLSDVPLPQLVVPNVRDALAALAREQRQQLKDVPVIAITGSAGKTSTRQMLEAVLKAVGPGTASPGSFNNDLGVPVTLLAASGTDQWVLVEIGTNAPGEIHHLGSIVQPTVVIVTGTGRAHLEGFGSEEAIAQEKMSLLDTMAPNGRAFVNIDRPFVWPYLSDDMVKYGLHEEACVRLTDRTVDNQGQVIEINSSLRIRLPLAGEHNALNALAVIAVARDFGIADDLIAAGLATVKLPPMRLEEHVIGSICVWNDAYNANPESMLAAIEAFVEREEGRGRLVAILGGMHELGKESKSLHREVGREAAHRKIDHLVVVGEMAQAILDGAQEANFDGTMDAVSTCEAAALCCHEGDRVLIKASRSERLERVLQHIEERMGVTR